MSSKKCFLFWVNAKKGSKIQKVCATALRKIPGPTESDCVAVLAVALSNESGGEQKVTASPTNSKPVPYKFNPLRRRLP